MVGKGHTQNPAQCCLLSSTKGFATGASFAPVSCWGACECSPGLPGLAVSCGKVGNELRAACQTMCVHPWVLSAGTGQGVRGPAFSRAGVCSVQGAWLQGVLCLQPSAPFCVPPLQPPFSLPETAKIPAAEGTNFPGAHGLEDREG